MGDVAYWDDDLSTRIAKLQEAVKQIDGTTGADRSSRVQNCETQLQYVNQHTKRTFVMELRQLFDKSSKQVYQQKLDNYERELEQIANELKWAKASEDRSMLFNGKTEEVHLDVNTTRNDLLDETDKVLDKTKDALLQTLQSAEQAKELGTATADSLAQQTEKLKAVDEKLVNMDTEIDKAQAVLKSFARRLMTDRLILVFVILIFIGLIVIIVYYTLNPNTGVAQIPDVLQPPTAPP